MRTFVINQIEATNGEDCTDIPGKPPAAIAAYALVESKQFVDTANVDDVAPKTPAADSEHVLAAKRLHDRLYIDKDATALPEWVEHFDPMLAKEARYVIRTQLWPTHANGSVEADVECLTAFARAEVALIGQNLLYKPGQEPLDNPCAYVRLRGVGRVMTKLHTRWHNRYIAEQALKQKRQDGEVDTPSIESADYGQAMFDARETVLSICKAPEDRALINASIRVRSDASITTEPARLAAIAEAVNSKPHRVEKRLKVLYEAIVRGSRENPSCTFQGPRVEVSPADDTQGQRVA